MLGWIKAAIIGAVIASLVGFHVYSVKQAEYKVKQQYEQILKDSEEVFKNKTTLIEAQSKALDKIKDEQIKTVNLRADNLLSQLRTRSSRPPEILTVTRVESSCTGRELYREDGEFLTREAARAERILTERNYYYEQYEQARKTLNELSVQSGASTR